MTQKNYYSKSQLQIFKQITKRKKCYHIGEIYPYIFEEKEDNNINYNKLDVAIVFLGAYELDSSIFPKIKCPICGKEEALIPYFCGASILSGCHIIKYYCSNCKELIVTNNDRDYYHKISDYIVKNRKKLKKSSKIDPCTSAPDDVEFF